VIGWFWEAAIAVELEDGIFQGGCEVIEYSTPHQTHQFVIIDYKE
jgi:hypothetical protein